MTDAAQARISVTAQSFDGPYVEVRFIVGKDGSNHISRLTSRGQEATFDCDGTEVYVRVEVEDIYGSSHIHNRCSCVQHSEWPDLTKRPR